MKHKLHTRKSNNFWFICFRVNKMINVWCSYLDYVWSAGYCIRGNGRIFSFNLLFNQFLINEPTGNIYWALLYESHVVCPLRNMCCLSVSSTWVHRRFFFFSSTFRTCSLLWFFYIYHTRITFLKYIIPWNLVTTNSDNWNIASVKDNWWSWPSFEI